MRAAFDLQLHHVALTNPHLALRVASFENTVARLRAFGIECLEVPDNPTPWAQIYTTDPDGNVIEFNVDRETLTR
jgi:catechol 2,3-dioxygenase-like lactoylglutathione lyase family enzyme